MKKHEIGDLVWIHGKGWNTHPLVVLDIIGNHDHIKVMSMKNNKHIWYFTPQQLHNYSQEQA